MVRLTLAVLFLAAALAASAVAQPKPGSASSVARAEQLFVSGMTRAYVGDYEGAIGYYERALELQPGEGALLSALAEAHEAEGNVPTALFFAARAVEASPGEPSTYRLLADLQLEAGESEAALTTYSRLIELDPRDVRSLNTLARIQQQLGRYDAALETYDAVLDEVGESEAIRSRMLIVYRQLGDVEGMTQTLELLVDLDPSNTTHRRNLAALYDQQGRKAEAVAVLERLLIDHPDDVGALEELAALYRALGNDAQAERALGAQPQTPEAILNRATSLYLDAAGDAEAAAAARQLLESLVADGEASPDALLMLGDLRYRAGEWAAAADALSPALDADPGHIASWAQLVAAHLQAGDADAAVVAADDATLLFPGQPSLVRIAAFAHAAAGNERFALRYFEEAIDLVAPDGARDERSALLAQIGRLRAQTGDEPGAEAALTEALDLDPDNAVALSALADVLAERGERLDDALAMARRAVEIDASNPDFLATLGWVHAQRGELDQAVSRLTEAINAGTPTARRLERLGDAEAARGNAAAARQWWEAALDLNPEEDRLRTKLRDLP